MTTRAEEKVARGPEFELDAGGEFGGGNEGSDMAMILTTAP